MKKDAQKRQKSEKKYQNKRKKKHQYYIVYDMSNNIYDLIYCTHHILQLNIVIHSFSLLHTSCSLKAGFIKTEHREMSVRGHILKEIK